MSDIDQSDLLNDARAKENGAAGRLFVGPFAGSESKITEREYSGYCRHAAWEIDPDARTVTCRRCGSALEPFALLLKYAEEEKLWKSWRGEVDRARARVEELKKEEAAVKARTRSHSRKDADHAVAEERKRAAERASRSACNARRIVRLAEKIQRALDPDKGVPHG